MSNDRMGVTQVRAVAARVLRDEPVHPDQVRAAQDTVRGMIREAADYGLSEGDVIRAVFGSLLQKQLGCDCHTCVTRRSRNAEEPSQYGQTAAA